jgi:hypothetical protein
LLQLVVQQPRGAVDLYGQDSMERVQFDILDNDNAQIVPLGA